MSGSAHALQFFPRRPPAEDSNAPKARTYRGRDGVGFRRGNVGTHTSRTIMLKELAALFDAVPAAASEDEITFATRHGNCLSKSTTSTRRLTHQRLTELYALDPAVPIYRVLRRLWSLEPAGRPLLALLVAMTPSPNRDPGLVRESSCPWWGWKGFSDEEATQCRADRWLASAG